MATYYRVVPIVGSGGSLLWYLQLRHGFLWWSYWSNETMLTSEEQAKAAIAHLGSPSHSLTITR